MRHVTLRNRVKRLEKRLNLHRKKRTVVWTCPELGQPIGLSSHVGTIDRKWGEPMDALIDRARTTLGTRIMAACYPNSPASLYTPERAS